MEEKFDDEKLKSEVFRFAINIFYQLKEFIYCLKIRCECKICASKTTSSTTLGRLQEVVKISLDRRRTFRGFLEKFALISLNPKLSVEDEREMFLQISRLFPSEEVLKKNGWIPLVVGFISEIYLFRYMKLRHLKDCNPCVVYLQSACKCFFYVYLDVFRAKYANFEAALQDWGIPEKALANGEELWNQMNSRIKCTTEIIKIKYSAVNEKSYKYQFIRVEDLLIRAPIVFHFAVKALGVKSTLEESILKVFKRYKSFYKAHGLISNCNLLFDDMDSGEGVPPKKKNKPRKRKKKSAKNKGDSVVPNEAENSAEDNEMVVSMEVRNAFNSLLKEHLLSLRAVQPQSRLVDHPNPSAEEGAEYRLGDSTTPPPVNREAQGFARDLFYFLKQQFKLRDDCKCEVCLDKDGVAYSGFTTSMGANVLTLSIANRKFFRDCLKMVVLKHDYPIRRRRTPKEEGDSWGEISLISKYLLNTYENGITYVLSLISETYLFKYLRLGRHFESNPCVDYLKATRSCFLHVYNEVLKSRYEDLWTAIKGLEVEKNDIINEEMIRCKMDKFCADEEKHKEKLKKAGKHNLRQYQSIEDELEPEFVIACEFVKTLSAREKGDLNKYKSQLSIRYGKFFKVFTQKYKESSSLMENYKPLTDEVENPINLKNIVQSEAETVDIKSCFSVKDKNLDSVDMKGAEAPLVGYAKFFKEDRIVCPIMKHVMESLIGDHFEPAAFPAENLVAFGRELFYCLKKLFKLNDDCRCQACLSYAGATPSMFITVIAGNVFTFSLAYRKYLRASIYNRILKHFNPTMDPKEDEFICEEIAFPSVNESFGFLYVISLISETYLYRYLILRQYCEIDPCLFYMKAACLCFIYFYDNLPKFEYNFFRTSLKDLVFEKYERDKSQKLLLNAYNHFVGEKKLNWNEVCQLMKDNELPHPTILACQFVDPLNEEQKRYIDSVYDEICVKYTNLYKKIAPINVDANDRYPSSDLF